MKILVTFALENEFAPWRAIHNFRDEKFGTARVSMTEINGAEIAVLITGVGPQVAGLSAANVIWGEYESLRCCISSGLAGALRPEYEVGQVLAARRVTTEVGRRVDVGRSGSLECSSALVSFAEESSATIVDHFHTTERAISRADEKRYLGKRADAVDMESFEIVLEALAFGVPAVAIRAISDGVDEDLPLDMNRIFSDEGQVSIPRVVGQVALRPQALPGLVKLGRQSKKAAESLAQFLDRYISRIVGSAQPIELKAAV